MVEADDLATRLWHEFHRSLHASHVRQFPQHRAIALLRIGTILGQLLRRMDRTMQRTRDIPYIMDDVQAADIPESINRAGQI